MSLREIFLCKFTLPEFIEDTLQAIYMYVCMLIHLFIYIHINPNDLVYYEEVQGFDTL